MPIYKRCSRCGNRIPSGTTCPCIIEIEARRKKARQKEYDQNTRNRKTADFYHSKEWELLRQSMVAYYQGMDIYSYYVLGRIEHGHTVHHIEPLKDCWDKRLSRENLIYLTESNHQLIHKEMKEGGYDDVIKTLREVVGRYEREFGAAVEKANGRSNEKRGGAPRKVRGRGRNRRG